MKRIYFLLVVLLLSFPFYAQAENHVTSEPLEISIEIQKNHTPMWINVDQTDFMKNQSDGFNIFATNKIYRKIGTAYASWQASDIYEILIYTDNINELNLSTYVPLQVPAKVKMLYASKFAGLRLRQPISRPYGQTFFVPFKVWVPRTAGKGQVTAPVNPDGSIDAKYFTSLDPDNSEDLSFFYVPEKMAVDDDLAGSTYGSYKKVIASAFDATYPHKIELTFAMDVTNRNIGANIGNALHKKYEAHVIIDLVGN